MLPLRNGNCYILGNTKQQVQERYKRRKVGSFYERRLRKIKLIKTRKTRKYFNKTKVLFYFHKCVLF